MYLDFVLNNSIWIAVKCENLNLIIIFRLTSKPMFSLAMKKYLRSIEQYQDSWKCNQRIIGKITGQKYNHSSISILLVTMFTINYRRQMVLLLIYHYEIVVVLLYCFTTNYGFNDSWYGFYLKYFTHCYCCKQFVRLLFSY